MSSRAKPEKSQSESARLPANFLSVLFALRLPFCLPLFLSRLQKSLCFQWLQSCFCLPFCLPVPPCASISAHYCAQSQNQARNLFFSGRFAGRSQTCLRFNPLCHKAFRWPLVGRFAGRLFAVRLLFCLLVTDPLALQPVMV